MCCPPDGGTSELWVGLAVEGEVGEPIYRPGRRLSLTHRQECSATSNAAEMRLGRLDKDSHSRMNETSMLAISPSV